MRHNKSHYGEVSAVSEDGGRNGIHLFFFFFFLSYEDGDVRDAHLGGLAQSLTF